MGGLYMSGKDGNRGYIYQGMVAILEALQNIEWDYIELEPNSLKDKIDVIITNKEKIMSVIQIKTTINSFGSRNFIDWIKEMVDDIKDAPIYKLVVVGNLKKSGDDFCKELRRFYDIKNDDNVTSNYLTEIKEELSAARIVVKVLPCSTDYLEDGIMINIAKIYLKYTDQISMKSMQSICKEFICKILLDSIRSKRVSKKELDDIVEAYKNKNLSADNFGSFIDSVNDKKSNNIAFHYLNGNIGFYGREKEIKRLDAFLNDHRQFLYYSVIGDGGVGKSKLIYSYAKKLSDNNIWKLVYLDDKHIKNLILMNSYNYHKNLLIVFDYAGNYAEAIGDLMYRIASLDKRCIPPKLRILLIERDGYYKRKLTQQTEFCGWYEKMLGYGEKRLSLLDCAFSDIQLKDKSSYFLELGGLEENNLRNIINDYCKSKKVDLSIKECNEIIENAKNIELKKYIDKDIEIRPLIFLIVTDYYLGKRGFYNSSLQEILYDYIKRLKKHILVSVCGNNKKVFYALEKIKVFVTATKEWSLGNDLPEPFIEASTIINRMESDEYSMIFNSINEQDTCDYKIHAIEPDLIGEYCVCYYLNEHMFKDFKYNKMLNALWEFPKEFCSFIKKCIEDLLIIDELKPFLLNVLDYILDKDNQYNNLKWKILTAFKINMTIDEIEQIMYKMEVLYSSYNCSEEDFLIYIGWLNEMSYNDMKDFVICLKVLDLIKQRYTDGMPQEVTDIYCSCFFNLASYNKTENYFEIYIEEFYKENNKFLCKKLFALLSDPIIGFLTTEGLLFWNNVLVKIIEKNKTLENEVIYNYFLFKISMIRNDMIEIFPMLYEEFKYAKKYFGTNSLIFKVCEDAIVKIKNYYIKINGTYKKGDIQIYISYRTDDIYASVSGDISLTDSERLSFEFDLGKSMRIKTDNVMLSGKYIKKSDDNIL